ncbi:MAG: J domain-containing protein [Gammaproteobacteria bacterium]
MRRGPREILGVGECAGRAEIVSAYRRLAMRWHPDRNSSPDAKARFQEIQRAYRTLQAKHAPRNVRALWDEMTAHDGEEYTQEIGGVWLENLRDNFPFAAAACLSAGALGLATAAYPGDWILFSISLLAADGVYKTGDTRRALRIESAFRLAIRLYWFVLLAAAVWFLARKVAGI